MMRLWKEPEACLLHCSSGGTPVIQHQVIKEGVTQLVKMMRWWRREEGGKIRGVRVEE
jgi:hypothetical protein